VKAMFTGYEEVEDAPDAASRQAGTRPDELR
jgi:hypothetical protein